MALSPDQNTLTDLIRRVLNYVMAKNDSELDAVATEAINGGINKINSRNWRKLIKQDDETFVQDQRIYDLPDYFRAPRNVERWNSSSKSDGRISYLPIEIMLKEHPYATGSDTPVLYAIDYDNWKIMFDVAPDASFVANYPKYNLWFHGRQPHLSGVVTISLPAEFEEFLVWYARAEVASFRRPELAKHASMQAQIIWTDLVADDNDTMTDWE